VNCDVPKSVRATTLVGK